MATTPPMSDPNQQQQGAPPSGGAPQAAPSQAPANPQQMALAQLFQVIKRLGAENPVLSAGLAKAAEGIQEAQTAMVTQPQSQPSTSNPPY